MNIQSTFLNIGSWARCRGGLIFCWSRGNFILFSIFFQIHFGIVYTWSMYHSLDQRAEWAELWKCTPTILMENWDQAICLGLSILIMPHLIRTGFLKNFIFELETFGGNFKINSILVRQIKSLKKMVVLSAKFTILISWSPICIASILVLASMKIASTSARIMHSNIKSGHPWWNLGWG